MVRVGGLQTMVQHGNAKADPSGMTPQQQLDAITTRAHEMMDRQYACLLDEVQPQLAEQGIVGVRPDQLTDRQSKDVESIFDDEIYSVYTPMAVDAYDQFPLIANQSLSICVELEPEEGGTEPRFAMIPCGRSARRFYTLSSDGGYAYILLEDIIEMFVDRFFPGEAVRPVRCFSDHSQCGFRVARRLGGRLHVGHGRDFGVT